MLAADSMAASKLDDRPLRHIVNACTIPSERGGGESRTLSVTRNIAVYLKLEGLDDVLKMLDSFSIEGQRKRILAARCPRHGKPVANLRRMGDKWTMTKCCDQLSVAVLEAITGA